MNASICDCSPIYIPQLGDVMHNFVVTFFVCFVFVITKTAYDELRQIMSRVTVVVIGGGPIGLLALIIAAKCNHVSRIILFEEKSKWELLDNNYQISVNDKNVKFLTRLGIDFDNIEGCWDNGTFSTRIGVFLEYIITKLHSFQMPVELRIGSKFTKSSLKELDAIYGRLVAIVCDGASGRAASLLGLSDEFISHSCKCYGAFALLDRTDQHLIPSPEIRVHNLNFDLNAYETHLSCDHIPQNFHMKLFGCLRKRCLSLAVPRGESRREPRVVKILKVALDQSVMRNVFKTCYNTYKSDEETDISDLDAARHMKFSPRLFEVKLSQRLEYVSFVEDANVFVLTEGEAARKLNFHTGMDINLGIRGLVSLNKFLQLAASAESEKSILRALCYKHNHAKAIAQEFVKTGMKDTMFV